MVGYYRLNKLGFRLAAGAHVVRAAEAAPLDAAEALVQAAEREAESIRTEARRAYQEEKKRGYEEGLEQARLQAVGRILEESKVLDDSLHGLERELTGIVVHAVRKLIDGFSDEERAEAILRSALKQMRREKRIQLSVAPSQAQHFRDRIAGIVRDFPEVDLVDVVEDPALDPPRVLVESSVGRVDGHFAQRLDELEEILRRAAVAVTEDETAAGGPR